MAVQIPYKKKRYALVGAGGRASFFYTALAKDFRMTSCLVGLCDTNQTRLNYAKTKIEALDSEPVPAYLAADFATMVKETAPDEVIVTSIDQKPMTIDIPRCKEIFAAVEETKKPVRVTFNYRYAPHNTKIYEILRSGSIGTVTSIHFEWMFNTSHGADYYRRWHRDKRNSGGLIVHKSTHHFDLVNFWLQSQPATVYAQGDLRFYGKENAENRGVDKFYTRAHGSKAAEDDPFPLHMEDNANLKALYLDAEHDGGDNILLQIFSASR